MYISIQHKGTTLCITQAKVIKYREYCDCCPIFVTQSRCDNLVFMSRSLLSSLHVSNTPGKDSMHDNPKTCINATLYFMPNQLLHYMCSTYV